ncbi:hypothetical protein GCM10020218_084810 [Dactylosporangium vinaceum]
MTYGGITLPGVGRAASAAGDPAYFVFSGDLVYRHNGKVRAPGGDPRTGVGARRGRQRGRTRLFDEFPDQLIAALSRHGLPIT